MNTSTKTIPSGYHQPDNNIHVLHRNELCASNYANNIVYVFWSVPQTYNLEMRMFSEIFNTFKVVIWYVIQKCSFVSRFEYFVTHMMFIVCIQRICWSFSQFRFYENNSKTAWVLKSYLPCVCAGDKIDWFGRIEPAVVAHFFIYLFFFLAHVRCLRSTRSAVSYYFYTVFTR